jgi:hypothetical protein
MMLLSLQKSGFAEALGPYRQMYLVLAQQRAWATTQGRRELDEHWRKIAGTAGNIRRLLADMATIMSAIENIETSSLQQEEAPTTTAETGTRYTAVRTLLEEAQLSPRRAAARGIDTETLDALARDEIVEIAGWGRGKTCRLSDRALGTAAAQVCADNRKKAGGT